MLLDKAGVAATCLDQVAHSCPHSCQACQLGSSTCRASAQLASFGSYSSGSSPTDKPASSAAAHAKPVHSLPLVKHYSTGKLLTVTPLELNNDPLGTET